MFFPACNFASREYFKTIKTIKTMNIRIAKKMLQKALNKEDVFTESFLNFYNNKKDIPKTFLSIFKKYFNNSAMLEDGTNLIINNPEKTFKELQEFNIYKYLPNGKLLYLSKRKNVFSVFIFY